MFKFQGIRFQLRFYKHPVDARLAWVASALYMTDTAPTGYRKFGALDTLMIKFRKKNSHGHFVAFSGGTKAKVGDCNPGWGVIREKCERFYACVRLCPQQNAFLSTLRSEIASVFRVFCLLFFPSFKSVRRYSTSEKIARLI